MTIDTVEKAVESIAKCANGGGFDEKTVKSLAKYFMGKKFSITTGKVGGNMIQDAVLYWVGFNLPNDDGKQALRFNPTENGFPDSNYKKSTSSLKSLLPKKQYNPEKIESAFVVPMIPQTLPAPGVQLTLPFRTLDLSNFAGAPKVVLTSQVTGCSFAIANVGNVFRIGHAQPSGVAAPGQPSGALGQALAERLHQGQAIFQGVPRASTFLIHPGQTFNANGTTDLGYLLGDFRKASILGLVGKNGKSYRLSFIVSISKSVDTEIVKLVTWENSRWKTENV